MRYRGASIRRRVGKTGTSWQVRWYEGNRLFSKTFSKSVEAEQFAQQAAVIKDAHSVVAASLPDPVKMEDMVPTYIDLLRAKNKPGSGHVPQVRDMLRLARERMGIVWVHEIDQRAVDRLVRAYGNHRSTLRKSISSLKTFLRWIRRQHLRIDDWVLEYEPPKYTPLERLAWNGEQVSRLLAACDAPNEAEQLPSGVGTGRGSKEMIAQMTATREFLKRQAVRPALWLMLRYGPRPIETAKLLVSNWDAASRTLRFPAAITKTGNARSFVVDEVTAQVLTQSARGKDGKGRDSKESLFWNNRQDAWTSHHLTDIINGLIQGAGLPGTAYCCRHTACSRLMVMAEGDVALVQSITGHKGLAELQGYLHATDERRSAIADAFNQAVT